MSLSSREYSHKLHTEGELQIEQRSAREAVGRNREMCKMSANEAIADTSQR